MVEDVKERVFSRHSRADARTASQKRRRPTYTRSSQSTPQHEGAEMYTESQTQPRSYSQLRADGTGKVNFLHGVTLGNTSHSRAGMLRSSWPTQVRLHGFWFCLFGFLGFESGFTMQLNVVWNSLGTTHSLEHMTTLLCQPGLPHPILLLVFQRHRHYCTLQWVPPSNGHHPRVSTSLQWVPPSSGYHPPVGLLSILPFS